jgi:hypothetical protein
MFSGLLNDWVTLDGSGTTAFIQDRNAWLDLASSADVALWLEVRGVTNPGAGTVTLTYETAPARDEALLMPLAPSLTLAASTAPVITKVRLADNPTVPLARFLRWKLAGTAAGNWSVTFRVHVFAGHGSAGAPGPSSLTLEGWWRGSFSGSPWVGSASAGGSGSRDLSEATNPPAIGAAQNGYTPAEFDGTNDNISSATAFTTFVSAAAGSIWCLFLANTAGADAGAGLRYTNKGLVANDGGGTAMGLTFCTAGVAVDLYDGTAWKEVITACSTGAYHLAQVKWDSTDLKLRIDSGAWASVSANAMTGSTGGLVVGRNYANARIDGRILDVGTAPTALPDATFDDVKSYINARYGLSL